MANVLARGLKGALKRKRARVRPELEAVEECSSRAEDLNVHLFLSLHHSYSTSDGMEGGLLDFRSSISDRGFSFFEKPTGHYDFETNHGAQSHSR